MARGDYYRNIPCKHEGCSAMPVARGMCYSHYQKWKRSTPGAARRLDVPAMILDSLPATRRGLEMETGLHKVTLLRHLPRLRKEGKVFIIDHQPPEAVECRWKPVYAAGSGPDHVVSAEQRKQAAAERERLRAARRVKPASFAALLAPLGV